MCGGLSIQTAAPLYGGFFQKPEEGLLFGSRKAWKEAFREIFFFQKIFLRDGFLLLFRLYEKVTKRGHFYVLFASAQRTKKQTGLRPATSVQNPRGGIFDKV